MKSIEIREFYMKRCQCIENSRCANKSSVFLLSLIIINLIFFVSTPRSYSLQAIGDNELQISDNNRYLLTVCDYLRRTLRGKTPVVLYIDGKVHLVGDVSSSMLDTCVGAIFSTTPGRTLKTVQLLA